MSAGQLPPQPGYFRVYEHPGGGFVDVHELHGKLESQKNLPVALLLAKRGEQVCLLPVSDLPGVRSPDATRDGVVWEFKMPEGRTANAIDKALRDGSKQAARVLLQLPTNFDRTALKDGLYNRTQRTPTLLQVAVLLGEALYSFSRLELTTGLFRDWIP